MKGSSLSSVCDPCLWLAQAERKWQSDCACFSMNSVGSRKQPDLSGEVGLS